MATINIAHKLFILFALICLCYASHRVELKNIEVLTLYSDQNTVARRLNPVPQLRCVGGSAYCKYKPQVVQCYNRGFDGTSIQWECKANLPSKYTFGKIKVSCEGYDGPSDNHILQGSCGLQYALELKGKESKTSKESFAFSDLFLLAIVVLIGFAVYYACAQSSSDSPPAYTRIPDPSPTAPPPPSPPGFKTNYGTPPPSYFSSQQSTYNPGYPPMNSPHPTSTSDGPGFWTGAAAGGALGYLFARNSGEPFSSSRYAHTDSFSNNDDSNFEEASGFGGTDVN